MLPPHQALVSILGVPSYGIHSVVPRDRLLCNHPHFTEEQREVRVRGVAARGHTAGKQGRDRNQGVLATAHAFTSQGDAALDRGEPRVRPQVFESLLVAEEVNSIDHARDIGGYTCGF